MTPQKNSNQKFETSFEDFDPKQFNPKEYHHRTVQGGDCLEDLLKPTSRFQSSPSPHRSIVLEKH
jgi:hypothetical protein